MKEYYAILGLPEDCSEADIKRAFRKLAFKYHPDTNPGNEKEAEARFKEINEAYGVLGDSAKRQQYDTARKSPFAGTYRGSGSPGFGYSQQDIFNGIFANRAMYEEMNRMFARAGLRFDPDFLNRVYFSGRGMGFRFFTGPGGAYGSSPSSSTPARKPNWLERLLGRMVTGFFRFIVKSLIGLQSPYIPGANLDYHADIDITHAEAESGTEKPLAFRRNGQVKNLMVKVPAGIRSGNKIRLKGMGMAAGNKTGDLYLHVRIKD